MGLCGALTESWASGRGSRRARTIDSESKDYIHGVSPPTGLTGFHGAPRRARKLTVAEFFGWGGGFGGGATEPVGQAVPGVDDMIDDAAVLVAHRRLRADEERLSDDYRAGPSGALAVGRVDLGEHDPRRDGEVGLRICVERRLHEVDPDRKRGLG